MQNLLQRWYQARRNPFVRGSLLIGLAVLLVFAAYRSLITNVDTGGLSLDIAPDMAIKVMLDEAPIRYQSDIDYTDRLTQAKARFIRNIRLPRIALAGLVGLSLALSGAGLQGVFRNPLVEPGLIGVSSGAAIGAVTAFLLGLDDYGQWMVPLVSFTAGVLTTLLVFRLAYQHRRASTVNLLLIGLAINAIASAYIAYAAYASSIGPLGVGDLIDWTMGGFGGTGWDQVEIVLPFVLIGVIILPLLTQQLNLMALGETEARHLGVHVIRLRLIVIVLAALMVGVSVAFVGIIGFVGLVVPHLIRLLFGPDHRLLLPASALGGAIFLIGLDVWARTAAPPTEIPIGVLTTLIGGPFFIALLLFSRRDY